MRSFLSQKLPCLVNLKTYVAVVIKFYFLYDERIRRFGVYSGNPNNEYVLCKIMALSEFEIKKCEKVVKEYVEKHRPPVHLRNEVDLSFRVQGQSV